MKDKVKSYLSIISFSSNLDIFFFLIDTVIYITRKLKPFSQKINEEPGFESAQVEVHFWGVDRVVDHVQEVRDDEGRPTNEEDHVDLELSEVGGSSVQVHYFHIIAHVDDRG